MNETIRFVHERAPSSRIVFGRGTILTVPEEVAALGAHPFLLASRRSSALLGDFARQACGHFEYVHQHVPRDLSMQAVAQFVAAQADVIVTIGGGSSTGFGKVIAHETGAPLLCIPTTYSGSERTDIWGQTHDGIKTTAHDPKVLPHTVVYDPDLLQTLPRNTAAPSAMNALAHSVEALWLPSDPLMRLTAAKGLVEIAIGLRELDCGIPKTFADHLLYGAFLSGTALAGAGTGFHHELAHILGGRFALPHAELHACLLPFTTVLAERIGLDLNDLEEAAADASATAQQEPMSADDLMYELAMIAIGRPSLAALGMRHEQLTDIVDTIAQVHTPDGRELGSETASWLLQSAYLGLPI